MGKVKRVFAGMLFISLAATPALAKEGHSKDPQKHLNWMTEKLDLSDQQRSQVEQIMSEYRPRFEALRNQMEALKKEKHEKIKELLSPEQKEKFQKMKEHKGRRWLSFLRRDK